MQLDNDLLQSILKKTASELYLLKIHYETWFKPIVLNKVDEENKLIILKTTQSIIDYINPRYIDKIKNNIYLETHIDYDIDFIIEENSKNDEVDSEEGNDNTFDYLLNNKNDIDDKIESEESDFKNKDEKYMDNKSSINTYINSNIEESNPYNYPIMNLDPKYTFERFIVGSNNNFAYNAAEAVANNPGDEYNPLFIYGGVGLGKTHLMHSIGHFVLQHFPYKKVLYITSEYFTNEFIDAIRNTKTGALTKFREKYRNIDVLLIDDIQFISGKDGIQEEFFHTFNALSSNKKQIVISSDKSPKKMENLEERIKSRFIEGLVADIIPPDYEIRAAILNEKVALENYDISQDIINYIAENITANIRELEGALNRVMAISSIEKKPITLENVKKVLDDFIDTNRTFEITPQLIINIVAKHYNVTVEDIAGKRRNSEYVTPRHVAMYLCREMVKDIKLKAIGNILGNRDHSTVVSACKGIEKILEKEKSKENPDDRLTTMEIELLKDKINQYK